jgi:hypothetical protein
MRFASMSWLLGVMVASVGPAALAQETKPKPAAADMAAMMEKAKKFTEPSKHHKLMEKFLGKWNTETRIFMGTQATPAEKGTAESSWLMDGRWLKSESKGTMMGAPFTSVSILGYDNFKQSYVNTTVTTADTAMVRVEGDLDPGGKALLMYGTLDEYLTGEHDKMVKTVFRFLSADKIVMEIHDLPIGEQNTKVVEVIYTRKP